jgi:drug/metabolite transporter (DMT)-like permease
VRSLSSPAAGQAGVAARDRGLRILAIALMCAAMLCFTGLDTSSKWLGLKLPTSEIVWARYMGSTVIALVIARPWARPDWLLSKRPGLQALRSVLLLGSSACVVWALRSLQLAESATIAFLTPIFVALAAGPLLGERVGRERMIAILVGFLGVLIATRPGTSAFQPAVLVAVAGVACNAGYVIATRKLADVDRPQTTLVWTQAAGVLVLTPLLPWTWVTPQAGHVWAVMAGLGVFAAVGHGLLIVAHRYAPAPVLTPFNYTQLVWMIFSGLVVFGDWPPAATLLGAALVVGCGAWLALRERAGRESGMS